MNSTSFSKLAWGAWSVQMASIVPSRSPSLMAAMSAAVRSGGCIFVFVEKPVRSTASSVSVK